MKTLTATLVVDGSSDRTLIPIIQFLLDEWSPSPHRILFAEGLHNGPLTARLPSAVELYPCDLLFVHRDAERDSVAARVQEVRDAAALLQGQLPHVCLVPVRMTESWLLLDEFAIRSAAGNPNGTSPLHLPVARTIEQLPDPKALLFEALAAASDLTGRRRRKFRPEAARHRVAELLQTAALRQLPSFNHAEEQLRLFFETHGQ
jgi:hypothetical protein